MKRIVDYDPLSGATTYFDYVPETDTTQIITEFDDVAPLLELNKAMQNDDDFTKKGIKNGWWLYASIPNSLIHKWLIEDGINVYRREDEKRVFRKLNSPEYRYLKTTTKFHEVR